jgi:hypothetical protein
MRPALVAAVLIAAGALAAVTAGLVQPPDLEAALTDLSDTLGTWTYALVGAMAFLETGAFVGWSRRARPPSCWEAWSPPTARSASQ